MAPGSGIKHKVTKISSSAERSDVLTSRDNKWLRQFRSALRGTGPSGDELLGVEGPNLVEEDHSLGLEAEAMLVSVSGEHHRFRIFSRPPAAAMQSIRRERIFKTTDRSFSPDALAPETSSGRCRSPAPARMDAGRSSTRLRPRKMVAFVVMPPLILVMAGVQDPGNVGTILRLAEAFGATGAIAAHGTADSLVAPKPFALPLDRLCACRSFFAG